MAQKLDSNILKVITKYLDLIRQNQVKFESVWLFGSYAEERADNDSDIDLAVVMPGVKNKFYKELELTKYRRKIDSRIEPHILNSDDINSPLYKEIIRRGIKIA
jgi:predicted nucleotidyltransferase